MTIYFAADHAGYELKEKLIAYVRDSLAFETIEDLGASTYDPDDDYPEIVARAARRVAAEPESRAIVIGGSGQGEAMAANRFRGVRAAVFHGQAPNIVPLSREHNDANILSLGARFVQEEEAKEAVRIWLTTVFSGDDRHVRRIQQLDTLS